MEAAGFPKRWHLCTRLNGVTIQKNVIYIFQENLRNPVNMHTFFTEIIQVIMENKNTYEFTSGALL
jgi:hypothetical protein